MSLLGIFSVRNNWNSLLAQVGVYLGFISTNFMYLKWPTTKDYRNMMAPEFETLDFTEWTLLILVFEYEWINK